MSHEFEIKPTGDPYNRNGWDVTEVERVLGREPSYWFRGDLSPIQRRTNTIVTLRRMYPGCKVRKGD
jgi:hypothetical protein